MLAKLNLREFSPKFDFVKKNDSKSKTKIIEAENNINGRHA